MSIPQLPGANPAAAYNPAAAAVPAPQAQQPAYFGSGVRFGSTEEADSVELSTDQPADAPEAEQQEGEQQAEGAGKSKTKKALVKLGLAAACAAAGLVFPPAFAAAALFGVLAVLDLMKGRKAESGETEGDAPDADAPEAEAPEAGEGADDVEEVVPEAADGVDDLPAELTFTEASDEAADAAECRTLDHSEETIKLSEVRNLIEDEGLRANVKTADVARVISEVLAEQYDNVEAVSPRATNKQIDKALAQAAVDYITENAEQFTGA